jgi:hypothetical protein
MKIVVQRKPTESDHWSKGEEYEARIGISKLNSSEKWLEILFNTNPKGLRSSTYSIPICPTDFQELAQLMMQANAGEAVKAFGVALQAFPISKPQKPANTARPARRSRHLSAVKPAI